MKFVGDDDEVREWQRKQSKRAFEQQLAALTDAEKACYDATTLELNRSYPPADDVPAAELRVDAFQTVDSEEEMKAYAEVDVLYGLDDPESGDLMEGDQPPLQENVFKDGEDVARLCDRKDDTPDEVRTNAVMCAGYRINAGIYKILGDHQKQAIEMVLQRFSENRGMLFAHGTGTGKTLAALTVMHAYSKKAKFVVVCPKTLILQWHNEMQKFDFGCQLESYIWKDRTDLCPQYGSLRLWRKHGGVGIMGFELYRAEVKNLGLTCSDVIVIDEAHLQLKSSTTLLHKALSRDTPCKRRLLLSGSPLQNRLDEYFNMIMLIAPGIIGKDYTEFYRRYGRSIERGMKLDSLNDELIESRIMSRVLHRVLSDKAAHFVTSEEVLSTVIPPKMDWLLLCDCDAQARAMLDSLDATLGAFEHRQYVHQYTLRFKRDAVGKLLKSFAVLAPDEQVLVFSQRTETLENLHFHFPGVGVLTGNVHSLKERQDMLDKLRATPGGILYIGLQVGGVGLNLNFASRCILADISWNPMDDSQAVARCHRYGQSRVVHVYRLCMRHTYEERAYWLAVNKSFVAKAIVNQQDIVRLYGTANSNDLTGVHGTRAEQLFLDKSFVTEDSCLYLAAHDQDWIHLVKHDDVVAKQKDEMKLGAFELSEAENRFWHMTSVETVHGPVTMTARRKPTVAFKGGQEHIYIRLDLRNQSNALDTTQLLCSNIQSPDDWQLCNMHVREEEDTMQVLVVYTSTRSGEDFLGPGIYCFKFRRTSADSIGDDSLWSNWVWVD